MYMYMYMYKLYKDAHNCIYMYMYIQTPTGSRNSRKPHAHTDRQTNYKYIQK